MVLIFGENQYRSSSKVRQVSGVNLEKEKQQEDRDLQWDQNMMERNYQLLS